MKSQNILVVEGNKQIYDLLRSNFVSGDSYNVKRAGNRKEISEYLKKNEPGLIVAEISATGSQDNIEAIAAIKDKITLEIIFIIGAEEEKIIKQAKLLKPFGLFVKPIKEIELITAVESACTKNRLTKKLLENEIKFRLAFENAHDGIVWADIETGKIIKCNRAAQNLYEKTEEEILKGTLAELCKINNFNYNNKEFKEITCLDEPGIEAEVKTKLGKIRTVIVNTSADVVEGAKVIQVVFHNITGRKFAGEILKKWANIFEHAQWGIAVLEHENEIIDMMNPAFAQMHGYEKNELANASLNDVMAPGKRGELKRHIAESNKKENYNFESVHLKKDGSTFPALQSITTVNDANGNLLYRIINVLDITERKLSEEALTKSEERFISLFNDSPIPIWEEDFSGLKKYFNKLRSAGVSNFAEYFEERPDELKLCASYVKIIDTNKESLSFFKAVTNELPGNLPSFLMKESFNVYKEEMIAFAQGDTRYENEISFLDLAGNRKFVIIRVQATPGYEKTLKRILISFFDITERKNAEENIKASLKEKEILLKEIHHRVKNNLQIISSLLNLQSEYIHDEESRELFNDSLNRIRSMALIHERLYQSENFSKINVQEYIKDITNYLLRTYKRNQRSVIINVEIENVSFSIESAIPLGLIINEVVSNSLKYAFTDRGSGIISIKMHGGANGSFHLILKDDGVGMSESIDFRNTKSLGLQLVNSLVEQLDGQIELSRKEGTEYTIIFSVDEK
jgi:PAS domain S-box-containing protein